MPVQPPLTPLGASAFEQALITTIQRVADASGSSASITTDSTLIGDGSAGDPLGVSFDAVHGLGVFEISVGVNGTYADLDAALDAAIAAPHAACLITLLDADIAAPPAADISTAPTLIRLTIAGAGQAFTRLSGLTAQLGANQWLELRDLTISGTALTISGGSGATLRLFGVRLDTVASPSLTTSGNVGATLEGCAVRDRIDWGSNGALTCNQCDIGPVTLSGGAYGVSLAVSHGYATLIGGQFRGQIACSGAVVVSTALTLWGVGNETPITASGGACSVLLGTQALTVRHSSPVALTSGTGGILGAGIIGGAVYGLPVPGTPFTPSVGGTWGSSATIPPSVGGASVLTSALLGTASGIATLTASSRIPQTQIASGTASAGYVPASDGSGGTTWTAPTGGGDITSYARVSGFSARGSNPSATTRAYFPTTSYATGGITVSSSSTTGTYFQVSASGLYLATATAALTAAGSIAIKGAAALANTLDPGTDTDVIAWESQTAGLYPMSCSGQVQLSAGDYVWLAASSGSGYPLISSLSLTRLA